MSEDVLQIDQSESILTITLNRPSKMNALNLAMREQLQKAIESAEQNDDVGVVILTGAGRAFCAGLDLKELSGEVASEASIEGSVTAGSLTDTIGAMKKPLIGAINGAAVTGGFELALACDLLIASTEARFADTHARIGIMPGWGLSQRLSRVIGIYRAKELSLTGNYLSGEQAERWGLVSRVVAPAELLSTCRGLAKDMLSCDKTTLLSMKRVINEGYARDFATGLTIEQAHCREHAKRVRPEELAQRREAVQARGRSQSGRE